MLMIIPYDSNIVPIINWQGNYKVNFEKYFFL